MAKTGYFGRGRNIDAAVGKATGRKPTKKKVAAKKAAPQYVLDPKTGRYNQK